MHRVANLRYFFSEVPKAPVQAVKTATNAQKGQEKAPKAATKAKGPKVNLNPVTIDFPLPEKVIGVENRLNSKNTFQLPPQFSQKNVPEFTLGKNVRLSYLMDHAEQYIDQVITVTGWARETRLAAKDTLLFIKLVDGSNTNPLQVVIESSILNWEDVKKAKIWYSFKLTGKIEKSVGEGQLIEMKFTGKDF